MDFEKRLKQLADASKLKVAEVDDKHALLSFAIEDRTQILWVIPYDDVWEFSCQSAVSFDKIEEVPASIASLVLSINAKNKRSFWCLEKIREKHVLSAMLNFPETALTAAEFERISWAIVKEVDRLERALYEILK